MTFPHTIHHSQWREQWAQVVLAARWLSPTRVGVIAEAAGKAAIAPDVIVPALVGHPNFHPSHVMRWLESVPTACKDDRIAATLENVRGQSRHDAVFDVLVTLLRHDAMSSATLREVCRRLRTEGFVQTLRYEGWHTLRSLLSADDTLGTALRTAYGAAEVIRCARLAGDLSSTPVPVPLKVWHFYAQVNEQELALAHRFADDPDTPLPQMVELPYHHLDIWAKVAARPKVPGPVRAKLLSTINHVDLPWVRVGDTQRNGLPELIGAAATFCKPAWYTTARLNTVAGRCLGQLSSHNPTTLAPVLDEIAANPAADLSTLLTILSRLDRRHHDAVIDWAETRDVATWQASVPIIRAILAAQGLDDDAIHPVWVRSMRHPAMLAYHLRGYDPATRLAIMTALPAHTGTLRDLLATHSKAA